MADNNSNCLRITSLNCRSVKSSVREVVDLCDFSDFVVLQEHCLLPHELSSLNAIHSNLMSTGMSAVDPSNGILVGRPYGGTAIMYKKKFANNVQLLNTADPCISAVTVDTTVGPLMITSVYVPTNTDDAECFECFLDTVSKIIALYSDSKAVHLVIVGDFNCQYGSSLCQLVEDNDLVLSDCKSMRKLLQ